MRAVCLVALAGCAIALPVPLEPSPITKPAGKHPYEKAGVALDTTCGDRFELAVSGVDDAVRDIRACRSATDVAITSWVGALASGATAVSLEGHERGAWLGAEIGVAVTALVVGYVAAIVAIHREHRAIGEYNAAIH